MASSAEAQPATPLPEGKRIARSTDYPERPAVRQRGTPYEFLLSNFAALKRVSFVRIVEAVNIPKTVTDA